MDEPIVPRRLTAEVELMIGTPIKVAARKAGLHRSTIYRWLRKDSGLHAAWQEARRQRRMLDEFHREYAEETRRQLAELEECLGA